MAQNRLQLWGCVEIVLNTLYNSELFFETYYED